MKLSVVTTLYFSEPYIKDFYTRVVASIDKLNIEEYEILFVNDGSPDHSLHEVLSIIDINPRVKCIDLSKNFGHHKAIMTGLDAASGDLIFLVDVDLEEDPELIELFWNELNKEQDCDVIYGVQQTRKGSFFEKISGAIFYKFFSILADIKYPHDTTTARLMTKKYVASVLQYKEKELEIWGIFVLAGFNQKEITVSKGFKGTSTYTLGRKLRMAVQTITSFSSKPLYLIFLLGFLISTFSLLSLAYVVINRLMYGESVLGWASIMASLWFIGGVVMFSLGIIGIYVSKIFSETKNRPLTIINKIYSKS